MITNDPIAELQRRYPWPDTCPDVEPILVDGLPHGWCCGENRAMIGRLCSPESRVVVELGSWLGLSTTFLLKAAPNATVIAIDHWKGSPEHQQRPEWKEKLPFLYETFLRHMWPYRERLIPMRTSTLESLAEMQQLGIQADLVYEDAAHDTDAVKLELETVLQVFPHAWICGDDWTWGSVRAAVEDVVSRTPYTIGSDSVCWWLEGNRP